MAFVSRRAFAIMPRYTSTTRYQRPQDIPSHSLYGDWAIPGLPFGFLNVAKLLRWNAGRAPQAISFADICAKPADWFGGNDFSGSRFERADISVPGVVVRDMPNPCEAPYRLIDGRRRLHKLRRQGETAGMFQVFSFEEVQPFIQQVILPV